MRIGSELAFSTAYLFAGSQPFFVSLDDITFHKPVEIGSLLKLHATVIYTHVRSI
jgi:acyl-coenzyme A thioesterase 9